MLIPEDLMKKKDASDMEVLNKKQVEKGLVRLKFKHPLTNSSFSDVFTSLKRLRRCCGKDEKAEDNVEAIKVAIQSGFSKAFQK